MVGFFGAGGAVENGELFGDTLLRVLQVLPRLECGVLLLGLLYLVGLVALYRKTVV